MKQSLLWIEENIPLARDVFRMRLTGDVSGVERPGQFVNLRLEGRFLRRPISVFDRTEDGITLIYKAVGEGTRQLARMTEGEALDALTGLGNGYDLDACPRAPVLAGGGVGVPPLYGLAKRLLEAGKRPSVALGFNRAEEIFYQREFEALGVPVTVATVDGSAGVKGFVTDALPQGYDSYCACGPMPMLKAVFRACGGEGQLSLEERMGCGFGACMGCTVQTNAGARRVCKEGPVFRKEELPW